MRSVRRRNLAIIAQSFSGMRRTGVENVHDIHRNSFQLVYLVIGTNINFNYQSMQKTIIIIGMGPGLSYGVARKFGKEGFKVGMISRNAAKLFDFQKELALEGVESFFETADVADTNQLLKALKNLKKELKNIDVLHYNAVDYRYVHILDEKVEDLAKGFMISVGNAFAAVKELQEDLIKSKGAVLLTGGGSANFPIPDMATISLGKAGIKNLAYQLYKALKPEGVYVGTLTVSNQISAESSTHSPAILANKFWDLYTAREKVEVVY